MTGGKSESFLENKLSSESFHTFLHQGSADTRIHSAGAGKNESIFMEDLCKKGEKGKHSMGWGKGQAVLHSFSIEQPSKSTISQAIGVGPVLQMDQQQPLFSWASQSRWSKLSGRGFLQQKVLVWFGFFVFFLNLPSVFWQCSSWQQ